MAVCVSNMASLSASSGCQALRVPTDVVKERSRSVRSLRGRASLGASLCGRASETEPINQSQNASLRLDATGNNLPRALWSSDRRGFSRMQCNALPANAVEGDEEEGTPWEGAVMFRRSATQSRFEYATTLERLGLARFSSEKAISVATDMGLTKPESDGVAGTPVQISVEVTKQGRDFQVDGVIRTALNLVCNRCLAPVAERIYASFNLLLTEAPVKEPTQPNLGVVLGEDVYIWRAEANEKVEAELDIDLDDKLHFPRDQKELDLSKYLRDTIHLELPAKSLCDSACAGVCVGCGVNLNNSACRCGKKKAQNAVNMEEVLGMNRRKDIWGPLEQLKKQLEEQQQDRSDDPK